MSYTICRISAGTNRTTSTHKTETWMKWAGFFVSRVLFGLQTLGPQSSLLSLTPRWAVTLKRGTFLFVTTRHQNDVTKDRAVLLYGIVSGKEIDVGRVIHASITRYIMELIITIILFTS